MIHDPTMQDSCINYANMLSLYKNRLSYQGSKNISMICKYLVSWVKKTSLTKKVATFKNCCFLVVILISWKNLKPLFPLILQIFDLECHGQTSLKVAFVKFPHIFMKFRKLESLYMKNKKLHRHKTEAATRGVL